MYNKTAVGFVELCIGLWDDGVVRYFLNTLAAVCGRVCGAAHVYPTPQTDLQLLRPCNSTEATQQAKVW